MIAPRSFFYIIFVIFMLGFLTPIVLRRLTKAVHVSLFLALLGSLISVIDAISFFRIPPAEVTTAVIWKSSWLKANVPSLQFEVRIDSLSAFFIILVAGFSTIVAFYSFAALQAGHFREQRHRIASAFNLFVWSTLIVVIVNDVFSLIVVLEIMTLAFGYLALFRHNLYLGHDHDLNLYDEAERHEKQKNARIAPQVYMIVSHTSTAFLVAAFLLFAIHAGSLSFDKLRETAASLSPTIATIIFLLALAGLGIRAGLTPAHFWVSLVHPSSPTPTHALSLGIAIKVAVYLMYRCFFQFLPPQTWWGYLVLALAVVTALVNVWYAIASHDLKTALAYHSIENIGIILVGIGVAMIFAVDTGSMARWITTLALIASLYHLLNHAVFKGLLYLCTGAIDNLTNQNVELEKLGGLLKRYPWTAATFLIGAASISGFPPFNGFISEWLTLQALLKALQAIPGVVMVICLVFLVAAFALTAFCFVKIAGMSLLGAPRSDPETCAQWSQRDVQLPMLSMMVLMATLCFALGVIPSLIVTFLSEVVATIWPNHLAVHTPSPWGLQLDAEGSTSLMMIPLLAAAAILAAAARVGIRALWRRKLTLKPQTPWNCGTSYSPANMQHTGAALSFLIRDTIGSVSLRAKISEPPDYLPDDLVMSKSASYPQIVTEYFRRQYNRWIDWLLKRSTAIGNFIQNGDLRQYLFYIFIANLIVLVLFLLLRYGYG
jgi:hydrogenase-4 component B